MAAARKMFGRVAHQLLSTRSTRGIENLQQSLNLVIKKGYANAFSPNHPQQQLLNSDDVAAVFELPASDNDDFLGANKLGKQFLINDKQQRVPVESLRGKIVGLYFDHQSFQRIGYCCDLREFYTSLKRTKPDSFEMIFVPSNHHHDEYVDRSSVPAISTIPWLSIPLDDLHWRSYLRQLYNKCDLSRHLVFIDTRDNKVEVLPRNHAFMHIYEYGPHFYPFTNERVQQLEAQTELFGKETSIQAILGSNSRDYLIDRHSEKVPISSLNDKDVLLYKYSSYSLSYSKERWFLERLVEIYNEFHQSHSFEIVSINFDHNGGDTEEETLWKDHLAQIPWLQLPFGDEQIWPLRMMDTSVMPDCSNPRLYVKPKGESLLDPYGYDVFSVFGIQAFPFSRRAAAENLVTRLKGLSFKSYVDEARRLGLDFTSLIRNKANGGTEHVSLSTILEGGKSRGGVLVLFANLENRSEEQLKSLIDVYHRRKEEFEVIFVSMDKDTKSFNEHFSAMPWFALHKPIQRQEHWALAESSIKIDFKSYSHFLAFGPDQLVLQAAGLITKSFENCEFPFVSDAESVEHATFCVTQSLEFEWEADGTRPYFEGSGWWDGIEFNLDNSFCYSY